MMISLSSKKICILIVFSFKKKSWEKLVNSQNEDLVDEKAYDLLTRMLTIDHIDRITASEALRHPYFEPVYKNLFKFPELSSEKG
jgi:serine/threonine protein kinase